MRRQTVFRAGFILVLLLALTASVSLAQESDPVARRRLLCVAPQTVDAVPGNAFTYQGQLLQGDEPVERAL